MNRLRLLTKSVFVASIERLRKRFVEEGLEVALNGKKRENFKEKVFDGAVEAHVVALRCSPRTLVRCGY